jgi:hypothetical protein
MEQYINILIYIFTIKFLCDRYVVRRMDRSIVSGACGPYQKGPIKQNPLCRKSKELAQDTTEFACAPIEMAGGAAVDRQGQRAGGGDGDGGRDGVPDLDGFICQSSVEMPLPCLARHEPVLRRTAAGGSGLDGFIYYSSTSRGDALRWCPLIVHSIVVLVFEGISISQWAALQILPHPTRAEREEQHLLMREEIQREQMQRTREVQRAAGRVAYNGAPDDNYRLHYQFNFVPLHEG